MNDYASIPITAGVLLIAHPTVEEPTFARTVVFLMGHSEAEGTMGVIVNRPLVVDHIDDDSPVKNWMDSSAPPATIFMGGPVEPDGYICLSPHASSATGITSLDIASSSPVHIDAPHRLFRGYSGWSYGQLVNEISLGGWFVVKAEIDDVFTRHPDTLWNDILLRQPNQLKRVGLYPSDVHDN